MQHEERSERGENGLEGQDQCGVRRGGMALPPHQEWIGEGGGENRGDEHAELHGKSKSDKERLPARHIKNGDGDCREHSGEDHL